MNFPSDYFEYKLLFHTLLPYLNFSVKLTHAKKNTEVLSENIITRNFILFITGE